MNKAIKELLDEYSKLQPLEVVYRPNERVSWGRNRKMYDGKLDLDYNHRTLMNCEIVFDFDDEKKSINEECALEVCKRLQSDNIVFSLWDSGNKGYHIHTFWKDLDKLTDLKVMKTVIMKYYAKDFKIDYQLAGKHLVRMEYGVNEKNRDNNKTLLVGNTNIIFNDITSYFIELYKTELNKYLFRSIEKTPDMDNKLLKQLLEGEYVVKDGREKFLFYLINSLKSTFPEDELTNRLTSWYYYTQGSKLTRVQIKNKIHYHYNSGTTYSFSNDSLKKLMKEYNVEKKIN